ncbi:MAG TPA: ACT domain-containing protein [Candidatus Latescibacteria bacterium]|jgi:glycine cleavage system regulatory protein|nr:glycine cleavage system protein R [Gemmatimonadaceae bacterium]MDP6017858.1 ACT domain-containing protein [Candidatus Latescibacterota bacterium]HJP32520.1 ACT domain-containing protein [Candidatus Latescibacterota bacterium]
MNASLVMTVIGDDRPGLVESVSQAVAAHGGSWQESRMARLAGKFAGVLRIEVAEEQARDLEVALRELASAGLHIIVESGTQDAEGVTRDLSLELIGGDRPGIVRDISHTLAERGVNIEELATESVDAPMSGGLLFKATARVRLPPDVSIDDLRQSLEALGHDLMVEISLADVEGPAPRA